MSLRTDSNQSWDVPSALRFIRGVEEEDLTFIEQPITRTDVDGLAYLRSKSRLRSWPTRRLRRSTTF